MNKTGLKLSANYKSLTGIDVSLDADTVRKYIAQGEAAITDQEIAFFLRTCEAKQLDPLEAGEVYLIKYTAKNGNPEAPAQIVVGKHAYIRRADLNPNYKGKKSGIVVVREGIIEKREGCCVYKALGETLLGGWCQIFIRDREPCYREVALEEYSSGFSNWKSKPATMIEKVAVAQCLREAFPNEYQGLYSEDEISPQPNSATAGQAEVIVSAEADPIIDQDQRKALFAFAKGIYGDSATSQLKETLKEIGLNTTEDMTQSQLQDVWERLGQAEAQPQTQTTLEEPETADVNQN